MGAPAIDDELMYYWSRMTIVQKESILSVMRSFVIPDEGITIEQYNKEVDEAMTRIDAGRFITQDDLEKESEQW